MSTAPDDPADALRFEIAEHRSIGFDRYMELALYGRGGFFHGEVVGTDAEFVTSPHVHPFVFSRCVRAALLETWAAIGEPEVFEVVELGAGDGTFAAALLEAFGELPQPELRYTAVEIGDHARGQLARRGVTVVGSLDEVEPFEGALFANELLDNLPFRLARRHGGEVREVRVSVDGDRFIETLEPWRDRAHAPAVEMLRDDVATVVPVGALAMIESIARTLRRGTALLVDYGELGPVRGVHGYSRHRQVSDVLAMPPGRADITAGVDLGAIAHAARANGLVAWPPVRQRAAIAALGYPRWDETMRERQVDLQDGGHHAEALRVFETRSRASILADPERLGRSWWLTLSTPDVSEPTWVRSARSRDRTDV
jgi:SAM-dependent MidA family methyltransferase